MRVRHPSEYGRRLARRLRLGPKQATATLANLLGELTAAGSDVADSPAWIADLYASDLDERQRACLRDAVVLLITRNPLHSNSPLDNNVIELARQIEVLQVGPQRVDDRLWFAAHERLRFRNREGAVALIGLLALSGRQRHVAYWDDVLEKFGEQTAVLCFQAIARENLSRALEWARTRLRTDSRQLVLTAVLPIIVRETPSELAAYLSGLESDYFAREVHDSLESLGLDALPHNVWQPRPETSRLGQRSAPRPEIVETFYNLARVGGAATTGDAEVGAFVELASSVERWSPASILDVVEALAGEGSQLLAAA